MVIVEISTEQNPRHYNQTPPIPSFFCPQLAVFSNYFKTDFKTLSQHYVKEQVGTWVINSVIHMKRLP